MATRLTATSETGFTVYLTEQEAGTAASLAETVYVIALEQGLSVDGTVGAGCWVTAPLYNDQLQFIDFGSSFTTPLFYGAIQSGNDQEPAQLRWSPVSLTDNSVKVKVEEEKSLDTEIVHGNESIGWIVIGSQQ